MLITESDKHSEYYEEGVSCPHRHDRYSEKRKELFQEQKRQIKLAHERGEDHMGESASRIAEQRRSLKRR